MISEISLCDMFGEICLIISGCFTWNILMFIPCNKLSCLCTFFVSFCNLFLTVRKLKKTDSDKLVCCFYSKLIAIQLFTRGIFCATAVFIQKDRGLDLNRSSLWIMGTLLKSMLDDCQLSICLIPGNTVANMLQWSEACLISTVWNMLSLPTARLG